MESSPSEYDKGGVLADSFWRTPPRAVPGRPHKTVTRAEVMSGSSYQQFQASVNDAWDLGDDDIISGIENTKISKAISQTAALNVINSHRNSAKSASKSEVKIDTAKVNPEHVVPKAEARKHPLGPGSSSGPMRHYPGRPRAVKLSALTSRDESNESKLERFQQLLDNPVLDLDELKQLSWSGIPVKVSVLHFRLLFGLINRKAGRGKR